MEIGSVQNVDINDQMRTAYLDYAMSVIVSRALPDARDGLKPVHRRILYAMHDMGIRANTAHKKSARIVGEVLGKYHPHGDSAVYDSMVRMAQDFSMRYQLVDGQGNFGSVDGDSPAAMRYTEARMTKLAEELLTDIEKNTVDFIDNFDGSLQEPLVLPARFPNLLLNGSSGIAVGMATNIPPHNLKELACAVSYIIDNIDNIDDIPIEELIKRVPGPDFPTGGTIIGDEGILQAYSTGKGRIVMRAVAHIEEMGKNRHRIVVTEIPYQVNKAALIQRIADLVRSGKLDEISDLRDESDQRGMSIVIELKRGTQPKKLLNQLFKHTQLQASFGVQMLALIDGEPRLFSLKRSLQVFIQHRQDVIVRRSTFELEKAKTRAHILEGLLIALKYLDEVIDTIRKSPDAEVAKLRLIDRFKLSEKQAQAILDMQLRRLAALERQKIEDEHKQILETIAYLEDLLAHPKKILQLIKEEIEELSGEYGDERRTRILRDVSEGFSEDELVQDEPILISITERGYVKRLASKTFRSQSRGGRGVTGHTTKEEDEVMMLMPARTLDTILFFSDRGKVYSERAYQIPDADRTARGVPIVNVLSIDPRETVTAAVAVPSFEDDRYCTMVTRQGKIKRIPLRGLSSVRPSGIIAINLGEDDELGWAKLTNGDDEIVLVTEMGMALRFPEKDVRPTGRMTVGVNAIRLKKGDKLASMAIVEPGGDLLVVTYKGYGKRTSLDEYSPRSRASIGVLTIGKKAIDKVGKIAVASIVQENDELTIISSGGVALRTKVKNISQTSRATKGVLLINLQEGDSVASIARIADADLRQAGAISE
jgi:DNA gyrase subunit A